MDDIRSLIDNLEPTSEGLYELVSLLDKPYDEARLDSVLSNNLFSKLVWNEDWKKEAKGKETNYSVLLSRHS